MISPLWLALLCSAGSVELLGPASPVALVRPAAVQQSGLAAPAAGAVWSLADCLTYALAHHPALVAEKARVAQDEALIDQARANQQPAITGTVGAQWVDKLPQQTAKLQGTSHLDTSAELSLSYSVWAGGRWSWRRAAAEHGRDAAAYHREAVTQAVLASVARVYGELWLSERVVAARQALQEQASAHALLARQRANLGKVAEVEAMRAEVNLATARDGLRRAEREQSTARLRLNEALGRTADEPLWIAGPLPDLPVPEPAPAPWREHPEWLRLTALAEQAGSQFEAARADRGPELFAKGNLAAEGLTNLPPASSGFAGLELRIPLFDGGRLRALADHARAGQSLAEAQLEALHLALVAEVGAARVALTDALARRADLTAVTALAERTVAIAEERYRVGAATPLEVFDAQTALLQVRLAVSGAEADVYLATNRLGLASGRQLAVGDGRETNDE